MTNQKPAVWTKVCDDGCNKQQHSVIRIRSANQSTGCHQSEFSSLSRAEVSLAELESLSHRSLRRLPCLLLLFLPHTCNHSRAITTSDDVSSIEQTRTLVTCNSALLHLRAGRGKAAVRHRRTRMDHHPCPATTTGCRSLHKTTSVSSSLARGRPFFHNQSNTSQRS